MNCKIAIFDLKGALAPEDQPLMLEPVLFCPVLTWMAQELMCCGVQRYFIVCRENWREEAREALQGFDAEFFDDVPAALSAAEEDVMVVPGPVVPVYGPADRIRRRCGGAALPAAGGYVPDRLPGGSRGRPHPVAAPGAGSCVPGLFFGGGAERRHARCP